MNDQLVDPHAAGEGKAGRQALFVACFVALVATSFAFIIRVMLMDGWQVEFNFSETQKGEIFGAGMWPFGLSIVLFSLVIDRIGYGKAMIFAFACHLISVVLMFSATGYWGLYAASILNGLAAGTVEAVINPVIASMYPKVKTKMLTILHAGWPGGFVLGGIMMMTMGDSVSWQLKAGVILIPVLAYGVLLLRCKFPASERVVAGVPYKDMLKEAGALGWLIVVYLIVMEINRVLGWANLVDTSFFDLPSLPLTIVMVALVGAYLAYTRTLGRGMYIFLLLIMILLAITELGTDTWIKDLMSPAMTDIGIDSGWVLIYTATIMMILRFCIGPIERRLRPLGVLFVSSVCAAVGIFVLAGATNGWIILVAATIYGTGQCFFWPVTLGLVSERFPRGGALTLNAIAGVGMLGVGIIGSQLLGFWQDRQIDSRLQSQSGLYSRVMDPKAKASVFGEYRSRDVSKTNAIDDKVALYDHRQGVIDRIKKETGAEPTAEALAKALADDKKYVSLVRNAFDHLTPAEPAPLADGASDAEKVKHDAEKAAYKVAKKAHDAASDSYAKRLAFLTGENLLVTEEVYKTVKADKSAIDTVTTEAKRSAMARAAILPVIMAACYLGLIFYFRSKGGYKAIELTPAGEVAGEHAVTTEEAVADQEATPSE